MAALVINMRQTGRQVSVYVAEQPEELYGCGRVCKNSRVEIRSAGGPQILSETLYIRGISREVDHYVPNCLFDSPKLAGKWVDDISGLIKKYNKEGREEET